MRVVIFDIKFPDKVLEFLQKELPRHFQVSDFEVVQWRGLSGVSFRVLPDDIDWVVCVLTNVFEGTGVSLDIPSMPGFTVTIG